MEVSDRIIDGPGAASLTIQAPDGSGSSVFITSGTTTLSGMTITGGDAVFGGGIRNESVNGNVESDLTVVDSVITGNVAWSGGGIYGGGYAGVYNRVTVLNSTISDNQASFPSGYVDGYQFHGGGGIASYRAYLTVDKSTISGNYASGYGGGIYAGNLQMTNSTVTGNESIGKTPDGYGFDDDILFVFNGTIANSTISGNLQGSGIRGDNVVVDNSTITNNEIGVYSVGGAVTLLNSIVVSNNLDDIAGTVDTAASRNNLIGNPRNVGVSHNTLGPPYGGLIDGVNGNIVGDLDPGVGPLADNGGPTETCALYNFSAAVNAGDNSLVPIDPSTGLPYATDQTGVLASSTAARSIWAPSRSRTPLSPPQSSTPQPTTWPRTA